MRSYRLLVIFLLMIMMPCVGHAQAYYPQDETTQTVIDQEDLQMLPEPPMMGNQDSMDSRMIEQSRRDEEQRDDALAQKQVAQERIERQENIAQEQNLARQREEEAIQQTYQRADDQRYEMEAQQRSEALQDQNNYWGCSGMSCGSSGDSVSTYDSGSSAHDWAPTE